jgi:hypothetical protein
VSDPELVADLMRAARAWRNSLVPGTSTGLAAETRVLIETIDALSACDHPRAQRVFTHQLGDYGPPPVASCGKCGATLDG